MSDLEQGAPRPPVDDSTARASVEAVVRGSYGRLVAYLAARSGDMAGAEDALSDALAAALRHWPDAGVPDSPEAWLLRAARRRMIDTARRADVRRRSEPLLQIAREAENLAAMQAEFPDERLKLLFVCAHPAVDEAVRTPLMLQVVLGLDVARIAPAFLVSPSAMEQRLVRAKSRIREARIPFHVPEQSEWAERVSFVLDAVYAAYTTGWEHAVDTAATHHALAREAIALGRALVVLMPGEPEALGLLALMLHCEARCGARTARDGAFVPLDEQDPGLWSRPMIAEAEALLSSAAGYKRAGRYQLEAAIHSIHAERATRGEVDWPEIALLYEGLVHLAPSLGAQVGRAVALAESGHSAEGLAVLDALAGERSARYQPWWAARAHLLRRLQRGDEARAAYERAASLTDDPALRDWLLRRAER